MNKLDKIRLWLARVTAPNQSSSQRTIFIPARNAGMQVNHDTALNFSAVYAAVAYRAETIASLPWQVMKRLNPGSEPVPSHAVNKLLHTRPNPYMSPFSLKCFLLAMAQLWGNSYLEIERDGGNRPINLWPLTSDRVEVKFDDAGALYYEVTNGRGGKAPLKPSDVYHLSGMGFDGIQGYSIVTLAQRSIGQGLAADQFMSSFYANGTVLSGIFSHPKTLTDEAYDRLKADFKEKYSGVQKSWEPLIVEEDMKWQNMGMPLQDAQFLENRKFTVEDIARWFRVPPHKIGSLDKATYSNITQQAIESVQESIMPWAIRMEQEADYKLIPQNNRNLFFTKINIKGLMRGDAESRAKYYQIMRNQGLMSANEIRALEDLNPIGADGDKHVMQSQYTTLEKIGEEPAPVQPQLPALEIDEDAIRQAHNGIFIDTAIRVLKREEHRAIDSARRYTDRGEFVEWMAKFYGEHAIYMAGVLKIPMEALCHIVFNGNNEKAAGQIDTVLTMFLYNHIKESRLSILSYYDDNEPLWDENERATAITTHLMDKIFNLAQIQGVNHEKEKRLLGTGQE